MILNHTTLHITQRLRKTRKLRITGKIFLSIITLTALSLSPCITAANDIFEAIKEGNLQEITKFIKDVNKKPKDGWTPLLYASCFSNLEVVKFLLKNGADINTAIDGYTVLHAAAQNKNPEIMRYLLTTDAKKYINTPQAFITYHKNCTPLHLACDVKECNLEIIKLLLDNGADVNKTDADNRTPLSDACFKANSEIVKLLLKNSTKESINKVDVEGKTPIYRACESHTFFVTAKGDVKINKRKDLLNKVKLLLDSGATKESINAPSKNDMTLVELAICFKDLDLAKFLLQNGANINRVNKEGETWLFVAFKYNNLDLIPFLLDNGAILDQKCVEVIADKPVIKAYIESRKTSPAKAQEILTKEK